MWFLPDLMNMHAVTPPPPPPAQNPGDAPEYKQWTKQQLLV